MTLEDKKNKPSRKQVILKLIWIMLYLAIFLYLFYLLINFGFNPLIISILLIFIILTTIGPFLRRNKRTLYSRMFSDKKSKAKLSEQTNRKRTLEEKELQQPNLKISKPINLEFEYRKPLINKCKNCGNIVPNFVKKCPFCNENIIYQ